jgi:uncharacterized SAM-binding protein YcdF (DUF218 family)
MSTRVIIYFSGIILIISLVYITLCHKAGIWLVKKDKPVHANAMVMLMGSIADRVLQVTDLYRQGLAGKVIIVEENMDAYKTLEARGIHIISDAEKVCAALVALEIPSDSIILLPGNATSTQMEAIIIRNYLADKSGIDTLILVSSAPHTRRASMIFKYAFRKAGKQEYILCSPSAYTNFDAEKWWRSKEGMQTVLMEYLKIANFLFFDRKVLKDEKICVNRW